MTQAWRSVACAFSCISPTACLRNFYASCQWRSLDYYITTSTAGYGVKSLVGPWLMAPACTEEIVTKLPSLFSFDFPHIILCDLFVRPPEPKDASASILRTNLESHLLVFLIASSRTATDAWSNRHCTSRTPVCIGLSGLFQHSADQLTEQGRLSLGR